VATRHLVNASWHVTYTNASILAESVRLLPVSQQVRRELRPQHTATIDILNALRQACSLA
jgi:hypothetical protein